MLRLSDHHDSRLLTACALGSLAWAIGGWPLKNQVIDAIEEDAFPLPAGASQLDGRPMWRTRDLLHYMRDHCATRYLLDALESLAGKQGATCTAA